MFEEIEKFKEETETFKKSMKEKLGPVLHQALKGFFDRYPGVSGVKWTQYTTYFTDGDTCSFSVNDVYIKFNDGSVAEDAGDYEDGWVSSWGLKEHAVRSDFEKLTKIIHNIEDGLELVFGDHVEVKADRNGITTEEYEHE